jgi:hypothetical protein
MAAAIALIVIWFTGVAARVDTFSMALTLACYGAGSTLAVFSLVFAIVYARSTTTVGLGIVALIFLQLLLNRIDPVSIAFALTKGRYNREIAERVGSKPRFIAFTMSAGTGFPAGGAWEYVVFDSSDEVGPPAGERTEDWKREHDGYVTPLAPGCDVEIRYLEQHFFYVLHRC